MNFNSPYRATSLRDFCRRWHMTLSRFLRDYLYVALGGNRRGEGRAMVAIALTFVLGGLWHGASWTFVAWGALNGSALIVHRIWSRAGYRLPAPLAWAATFLFVCVAWVFFRAHSIDDAWTVLRALWGAGALGMTPHFPWTTLLHATTARSDLLLEAAFTAMAMATALAVALQARNSAQRVATLRFEARAAFACAALLCVSLP